MVYRFALRGANVVTANAHRGLPPAAESACLPAGNPLTRVAGRNGYRPCFAGAREEARTGGGRHPDTADQNHRGARHRPSDHEELSDIGILVLSAHVEIGHAMADRISRVGDFSICVLSPSARSTANGSATLRAARHHPRASLHTSPASTATSARSTASPSTCARGPPSPPTAATSMHGWPSPSPPPSTSRRRRPHIAPRATELHALRSAIPTRHTVMMGPWVPPPTSRAPAPCQITSAIPGHIALGVTPNTALGGPQTAERPQPRGWVRGVRSVRGLPTERKPVDLAKHGGDSGGFGLRLDGVEPLVGIVAAEGRQTGFDCPLGRFRPSDRF